MGNGDVSVDASVYESAAQPRSSSFRQYVEYCELGIKKPPATAANGAGGGGVAAGVRNGGAMDAASKACAARRRLNMRRKVVVLRALLDEMFGGARDDAHSHPVYPY